MIDLSASIRFYALRSPERAALVYDNEYVSYGELDRRVHAVASYLAGRGIRSGSIVGAFMKNSPAFLELVLATSYLGAIFLPINYRLTCDESRYIIEHAGADIVFVDKEFDEICDGLANVVQVDIKGQKDLTILAATDGIAAPRHSSRPSTVFRIMYTSGTTDRPKGVIHTYENFHWKCMAHIAALEMTADDRLLIVGPLYHVGAFDLPGLAQWLLGGTIVLQREFDETEVARIIEREKVSGVWLAPVMIGRLLSLDLTAYDLTSLKWCIGGGEKTPVSRIQEFQSLLPRARFVDAYGLTESSSGDTLMERGRELEKIGSTGRPVLHVELEIQDAAGHAVPAGCEGEICLRGPKITGGYWRSPQLTQASFRDGWFLTGDLGYLDVAGFLYLTDRKKDIIISGGENISASEVERVIYEMPQVAECAVIGMPDEFWGERVVAFVVVKPESQLSPQDIMERCRRSLARFKVPRSVFLHASLPRNPSGKILKRILRERGGKDVI